MKTTSKILLTMVVSVFVAGQTIAQTAATTATTGEAAITKPAVTTAPGKFVDADKNGVCDNFQARAKSGNGPRFTDKNGDGVCDNQGLRHRNGGGKGKGCGYGQGRGQGNGQGRGQGRGQCIRAGNQQPLSE